MNKPPRIIFPTSSFILHPSARDMVAEQDGRLKYLIKCDFLDSAEKSN
jgi:hypothetical protein